MGLGGYVLMMKYFIKYKCGRNKCGSVEKWELCINLKLIPSQQTDVGKGVNKEDSFLTLLELFAI